MHRKRVTEQVVMEGSREGARRGGEDPQPRRRAAGRWAAMALVSIAALGASGASGCGDTADSVAAGEGHESIDEAADALKTQKLCVKLKPADSMISAEQPAQTFGASSFALSGPSTSGLALPLHALFRFDTSVVPATATVLSASLSLRQTNNGAGTATAHLVSGAWNEATVTWNSLGGAFSPVSFKSFSTAAASITINLLPQVQAWVDGSVPNNGFLIKETDGFLAKYYTKEWAISTQRPTLDVCYEVNCAAGFADCNNDPSDGCEADLASAASCGACGNVCANGACFGGSCAQCAVASTCPGADTECQTRTCNGGACGFSYAAAGTAVAAQTTGDCQKNQCNGAGAVVSVADNGDPQDDGKACTQDGCANGAPTHTALASGAACNENGGMVCDGSGACVACVVASTCPGVDTECQARTCVAGACGVSFTPAGTPVAQQSTGDCSINVCNGQGGVASVPDAGDLQDDGNQCTADSCANGAPVHTPFGAGTACNQGGGLVCNGAGACVQCVVAASCPGEDNECQTRTCNAGACGFSYASAGTVVAAQVPGDCKLNVCNGAGSTISAADDTDLQNDNLQCTSDACSGGNPTHAPLASGAACSQNGGSICNGGGACVECLTSATCPGNACVNGFCGNSPQCADGVKNGQETGIDCGGVVCPACASGKTCSGNGDCQSGKCTAGVCTDVLLLGEIQSRGSNGGNDEFVEIYNPMNIAAVFDATWTVSARSAVGTCSSNATAQRFAGGGQTIPSHGHLLYVNNNTNSYDGPKAGDGTYSSGFLDASSVMLNHGAAVVDAVCFYFDQATLTNLKTCGTPYICEGQPVSNLPHANFSQASENIDVSLERKPGGAAGNGTDTNNNSADFVGNTPANPQNLASPPSPCLNCAACVVATDCPGVDTECSVRSCYGGVCEHTFTAAGTVTVAQTTGDCHQSQCDGLGNSVSVADNTDLPNDNNQCTTDACSAGTPSNVAKVSGTACAQNGGTRCNGSGTCVQCLAAADCGASTDCATWSCVNNTCQGSFAAAGTVTSSQVSGDCKNNQCDGAGHIVTSTNNADLPVDNKQCTSDVCTAGAPSNPAVASGTACNESGGKLCNGSGTCVECLSAADCSNGAACGGGVCAQPIILLISQIQTRGSNGGNDEFVEIYNPTNAAITFDNTWTVSARSAVGTCTSNAEALRFSGSGQVIGPHKHLLFINNSASGYNGAVSGDATYTTGIVDAASVVLRHGATVVDAMCFYFNAGTQSSLTSCATPFICEGAPISNLPHDNTTAGLSNSDASLERKPGGAGGNTVDTGVTLNDFISVASAVPHNLSSAATP